MVENRVKVKNNKLNEQIEQFKSSLSDIDKYEKAAVYNTDGTVFLKERAGTINEVIFTPNEYMQMRGKILVHSHINTGDLTDKILSPEDLFTAAYFGMKGIQAITKSSVSAFSPGIVLIGNTGMRNQFINDYENILYDGKKRVAALAENAKEIDKVIFQTAKKMSDYLKSNERKYGYKYEERGVFD